MKQLKPEYPNLEKLKVPIFNVPVEHILLKTLMKALTKNEREKFHKYFGAQTCPLVDAGTAIYPWDAEAVLERMFSGKLTGSQLIWD